MPDFFHYDPVTGVRELFDYDEATGVATVRREQDVQPFIDHAQRVRNAGLSDAHHKANGQDYFTHYAIIPPVVQMALLERGIDIHNPAQTRELLQVINRDYPYLKVTEKRHESSH